MRIDRYFSRNRIVELEGDSFEGCLEQLIKLSTSRFKDLGRKRNLLPDLLDRENTMTTYLGHGVALPHLRLKMKRSYVFAVGRSKEGIVYDGAKSEEDRIHLIILLLAAENTRNYLNALAAVARLAKDKETIQELIEAPDLDTLYDSMIGGFRGLMAPVKKARRSSMNKLIFGQAVQVARGARCKALVIFGDIMNSTRVDFPKEFRSFKTVLVTSDGNEGRVDDFAFDHVIQARSFSKGRLAQARTAFLVGLTRKIFAPNDKICCVGGIPDTNQFDSIVVVDLKKEFHSLMTQQANIMPSDVIPEVLERVLGVAMELAVEGREGRPVGALFVLGDHQKVERMTKPLVLNPFHGYKEEDKNILNPFMDETVKEFSGLDGAFVLRGDGVLVSAGSLIHAPDYYHSLPGGLGARHAAAAAISLAADCVSIVVSSSTGQVTVFRKGISLQLMEKPHNGYSQ